MTKQCPRCNLNNSKGAKSCVKCLFDLAEVSASNIGGSKRNPLMMIIRRAVICLIVIILVIAGFYYSLVFSAKSLSSGEQETIDRAIEILDKKGFAGEVFYLRYLTVFRANDNWLNASVPKENAYAATNYPFEIMTIYPDYFTYTQDDTERAAILLHEAIHLRGLDEKAAYEFVWRNKKHLGWTKKNYGTSVAWREIRKQTREYVPNLFVCEFNDFNDCTE